MCDSTELPLTPSSVTRWSAHLMTDQSLALQKGLDAITSLLTTIRTKEAQVNSEPATIQRSTQLILMQMIAKMNPGPAEQLLRLIGRTIFEITKDILTGTNPKEALQQIYDKTKKDQGELMFTVNHETLKHTLETIRILDADRCLNDQNDQLQSLLKKQGLTSKQNSAAIDSNYTPYRGKYYNQCHPMGYQGQKDLYRRSFGETTVFQAPQQFIVKSAVKWQGKSVYKQKHLPTWLPEIIATLQEQLNAGLETPVIYGDKEFYSGVAFAFAYLGLFLPELNPNNNPRLVVPMKWYGGTEEKFAFLIDSNTKNIIMDNITVDYYQKAPLEPYLSQLKVNATGTKIEVPIWQVAVFDSYLNKQNDPKTLEWARNHAKEINCKIALDELKLKLAEWEYTEFQKKNGHEEAVLPTYKGKRRWRFKNQNEAPYYRACCAAYDRLNKVNAEKAKLCKRLMFYAVSKRKSEAKFPNMNEIIELVKGYHQRWGIENAFKAIKYTFLLRFRSCAASAHHIRRIASILVYNAWQYFRWTRAARKARKYRSTTKLYRGTLVKKRNLFEVPLDSEWTADAYLLSLFELGIKNCLKTLLA
jgi:hypothetical protein